MSEWTDHDALLLLRAAQIARTRPDHPAAFTWAANAAAWGRALDRGQDVTALRAVLIACSRRLLGEVRV
jgi:hypothetical protein